MNKYSLLFLAINPFIEFRTHFELIEQPISSAMEKANEIRK